MDFFDSHSHLEMPRLYPFAPKIVERARQAGVIGIIVSAVEPKFYSKALDLMKRFPGLIWPTFGLHPPRATPKMVEQCLRQIEQNADQIVAIGEVGLDYHWVKDPQKQEFQKTAFIKFVHAAVDLELPLVVHSRLAEDDAIQILQEEKFVPAQLHCFNDPDLVLKAADHHWLMSVPTSVVTRKRMQQVVAALPMANMLLETDAPYLSPQPGRQNEPANLSYAADKIAEIKGISPEIVAKTTTENALTFFRLERSEMTLKRS